MPKRKYSAALGRYVKLNIINQGFTKSCREHRAHASSKPQQLELRALHSLIVEGRDHFLHITQVNPLFGEDGVWVGA